MQSAMRRILLALTLPLLLGAGIEGHAQQAYPSKPINVVVAWPPGGSVDTVARIIAEPMRQALGQPLIVSNRAGATGTIGASLVTQAAPDGYTLLLTIGAHPITSALMSGLPYDGANDFVPITLLVRAPNMLVVRPDFPARTLQDFIKLAKAAPGKYSYSTAGNGTTTHLMIAMLERSAGISLNHVPYQGGAASLMGVLSAQTDMNSAVSTTARPMIAEGKLRALAIAGDKRSVLLPDVPTFAEAGVNGVRGDSWIGMFAPKGTPRAIVDRLDEALQKVIAIPDVQQKLLLNAGEPVRVGPAEFDRIVKQEIEEFRDLGRAIGLKMQ